MATACQLSQPNMEQQLEEACARAQSHRRDRRLALHLMSLSGLAWWVMTQEKLEAARAMQRAIIVASNSTAAVSAVAANFAELQARRGRQMLLPAWLSIRGCSVPSCWGKSSTASVLPIC